MNTRRLLVPFFAGLLVVAGVGVPIDSPAIAAGDPDACTGDAVVAPNQVSSVYQITTAGELKHVANTDSLWSGAFLVKNDISLANCGDWAPIGNSGKKFTGTFDGGGHSISGLVIDRPNDPNVGLFGFSEGASFTGVKLVGVDVEGESQVGALVGKFVGTTESHKISASSVSGAVVGADNDIGGLVGFFESTNGVVESSFSLATVTGPSDVGGLVGEVDEGSVRGSYATGTISATETQIGGLVGDFEGGGNIENSYATGNVTSTDEKVGGLVGDFNDSGDILNSHAEGRVQGVDDVGGLVGDFDGSGNIESSYAVGTVIGDNKVGGLVGKFDNSGEIKASHATGVVTGTARLVGGLVGYFFGAGAIVNSYATGAVTGGEADHNGIVSADVGGLVGIFESLSGRIQSSYATGNVTGTGNRVGGLIGWFLGGVIDDNSYATGTVTGESRQIGGLIGRQGRGDISTVHATGNVIATGVRQDARDVGGLVGAGVAGIRISGTYATGSVTAANSIDGRIGGLVGGLQSAETLVDGSFATGAVVGASYTGGLVGRVYDGAAVELSYASNSVQGADNVGGLVGGLDDARSTIPPDDGGGVIRDSYATGTVVGENKVGGLVGFVDNSASVITSYSTALASGDSLVGGLVGEAGASATAVRSFWDIQASGLTTSAKGTGINTSAMKTIGTYTSVTPPWNIISATAFGQPDISATEVWGIGAGVNCGYPFLYWQQGSGHSCPAAQGGSAKRADAPAIAMDLQALVGDRVAGAPVVIGGEGLAGNTPYSLIVRSTPTIVDSGSTTALGNFSARVTLPNLPPGTHTLTLSATAPDGTTLTLVQTITVSPSGTFSAIGQTSGNHTRGLAATGMSDQSLTLGLSGFAILAGVLLLAASRRRFAGR